MSKEGTEEKPPMMAIDYRSDTTDAVPVSVQPRQPRNLPDLLRYSTEAANALGETSSSSSFVPLDDEVQSLRFISPQSRVTAKEERGLSKKFLDEALKSMSIDVVEELLKHIKVLQKACLIPEDGDPTDCETALDQIFDYVDNLDIANDFHKIGGFCVLKPCLESSHSSLRWRGAELVAELCQNNPYCQGKVLETGLMLNLLQMIDLDVDDTVRIKALYAVSCLVRENEDGLQEFINNDGLSVLLRALQTDLQKLNIKSAFLLSSLCHWRPQIKDDLVNMGYVEQLISQLATHIQMSSEGHPPSLEHLLSAVLDIVSNHKEAQEIARRPELQFKTLLDYIAKNSEENDQFKEENEHAKDLIRVVFGESENSDEER